MALSPELETKLENIVNKTIMTVLIISCIAGVIVLGVFANKNAVLNKEYQDAYSQFDIYTLPASDLRLDVLDNNDVRLKSFASNIVQKMLTFSPDNYSKQRKSIKRFLTPEMLVAYNKYNTSGKASSYQVFIQDGSPSVKVTGRKTVNGEPEYSVTINGKAKIAKKAKKSRMTEKEYQIDMVVEKTSISKTNPYGFLVSKYQTTIFE